MSCTEFEALFGRQLDGRLEPERERALEGHLAGCAGCRAEHARWRAASRALRTAGPAEVPVGLAERSWRRAVSGGEPSGFLERFVTIGRRVALAGALAGATAWAALLAGDGAAGPAPRDAVELVAAVWSAEILYAE